MKWFKPKAEAATAPTDAVAFTRLHADIQGERTFWDDCVSWQLDEGMNETEIARVVANADKLLAARKDRFPIP